MRSQGASDRHADSSSWYADSHVAALASREGDSHAAVLMQLNGVHVVPVASRRPRRPGVRTQPALDPRRPGGLALDTTSIALPIGRGNNFLAAGAILGFVAVPFGSKPMEMMSEQRANGQ